MNPLPSDIFARRLKVERERQSLSQAHVARVVAQTLHTNVDPSAITRIEQQTRAVRLDEAVAIAQVLDLPLQSLLMTEEDNHIVFATQKHLAQLAIAQYEWDQARQTVERLGRIVHSLSPGFELYRQQTCKES